jgi:membrane fusion protein, heavy metal efflux system
MIKPRILPCLALLLLLVLALSGCQDGVAPPEVKGEAQQATNKNTPPSKAVVQLNDSQIKTMAIQTVAVSMGMLPSFLTLTATVQAIPNQTFRIGTPVAGKIESISVNLEDVVSQDQTLVTLFSNDIGQAQSDLLNTLLDLEATRLQTETDLQLAKSTYLREQRLYDLKVSARADMEAAQANYHKVQQQLQSLHQKRTSLIAITDKRLQLLGATPGNAQTIASSKQLQPRIYLKANRQGLVTSRTANPGEWVDANTEILTIADLGRVWVVAQAFEKDLPALKVGQSVVVKLDGQSRPDIAGKIVTIGSVIHPETRTLDVRIAVDNPHLWLKPNLFSRVQINVGRRRGMIIPRSAIQTFGDQSIVYIKRSGKTFEQKIITPESDDHQSETVMVKGLHLHDMLVTQGSFELHGEWVKQQY